MRPGLRDRPLWRGRNRERREGVRRGHGQYPRVQGGPGCTPSPGALLLRRGGARHRRKAPIEREQKGFGILSLTRKRALHTSTEAASTTKSPAASHTVHDHGCLPVDGDWAYIFRKGEGGGRDIERKFLSL